MLSNQLIERFVIVDGLDDVIAEWIEIVDDEVTLKAVGFAKADDVKPMTPPALSVAG